MDPKPAETPSMDPEVLDRANAGEEAHQLAVGKHYMVLAESGVKPEENGNKATEWLILASKQGNDTATELLCRCMDTKLGITEKNEEMIKWCLTTSSMEKKVRYAARRMFGAINKAHKDVLSKEEYLEAIKEITGDKHTRKLLVAAGKKIGDAISEDAFVKTVSKRVQGKINLTEEEAAEQTEEYRRSSIFKKILKHPITTGKVIGQQMLEIASKRGTSWLISLIPTNQIYIMLLLFIYGFITPSLVFFFVPLFFFYLSFAAMVISTLQMFYGRQKLSDTSTLTSALKNFDIGVDVESVESQFCWNSLTPYIVFFSSIIASVISFSLANKSYIPCSEVCIIALIFAVSCFIALSDSHDHLTLMTVGSNLLASLPIILDGFPNIPVLIHILKLISSPFFQLQVHLEDGYSPCTLLADYRFTDQLLTLRDGDEIEFVGLIGENLAFAGPKLYLRQVSAKNRELPAMLEIAEMQDILKITLVEALSVTVRFFWFPLFEFNPEGHAY
ncbi:WFS1 [Acanthosepion pharaonis]|uniref:WFS1 n=1 Tax=Acanthosepion pharaonis TaxID=158019 RepID=A0A812EEJ3_ACAPH|nr:WFS1 [Sepia pharaonis]